MESDSKPTEIHMTDNRKNKLSELGLMQKHKNDQAKKIN